MIHPETVIFHKVDNFYLRPVTYIRLSAKYADLLLVTWLRAIVDKFSKKILLLNLRPLSCFALLLPFLSSLVITTSWSFLIALKTHKLENFSGWKQDG